MGLVVIIFILFPLANLWAEEKSEPLKNISVKALDGRPEEIDSNGDGKTDIRNSYGFNGRLEKAAYDNNFDGTSDEWLTIEKDLRLRIIHHESHKEKILEHMDENGVVKMIEKFQTTDEKDWQLLERKTYLPVSKIFKVEEFINGKVAKQRMEPAEIHMRKLQR